MRSKRAKAVLFEQEDHPVHKCLNAGYISWLRKLWTAYEKYAPPSFQKSIENINIENIKNKSTKSKIIKQAKHSLDSLTWEMLLANMLLKAGFSLAKACNTDRPDLCVEYNNKNVWIECYMPTHSTEEKEASVRELETGGDARRKDTRRIALRFTQGINKKKEQHSYWLKKGICKADEPYIIALHGKNLDFAISNDRLPDILRVLYGMGDMYASFNPQDSDDTHTGFHYSPVIKKTPEAEVSTIPFKNDDYRFVTGVLFSNFWRKYHSSTGLNSCYVKNVNAKNPNSISFARFAQEYEYVEREEGLAIRMKEF